MVNSVETDQNGQEKIFRVEKHPESSMAQVIFLKDNVENRLPGKEALGSFERL